MSETFDFIVVGSGAGSMCAALKIRAAGKSVLVLEKTDLVNGSDDDFGRGSHAYDRWLGDSLHSPNKTLGKIEQGPFYALRIYPGDLGTFGGLLTDKHARVLREDGSVIEGLYATGTSTASVMGDIAPGAGGSIGPAITFAYVAAKYALQNAHND